MRRVVVERLEGLAGRVEKLERKRLAAVHAEAEALCERHPVAVDPVTAQLTNLANLHSQGILSDEEYAAAKAKALGI